ncbi:MAG: oxygenase MpaB family protein [Actinomycetota bacterium]
MREKIATNLRARVVGPNANQRTYEIMDAPGERWFAEDRPIRLVHGDASMFIGGLRALLLQSLHPLAMAGVANYSDYRKDPWGRLQRTADFLAATSFGPADEAQKIVDRVKAVHLKVNGVASDGRKYSATDPHLLKWVHVAEIDSFLWTYQKFSKAPLDQAGRDGYVQDAAFVARQVGVVDPPETEAEMRAVIQSYRPELKSTRESRDATKYLLFKPPLPGAAKIAYWLLVLATIATLPVWTRIPLRVPYLPIVERVILRPLGYMMTAAIRWVTSTPVEKLSDS